MSTKNSPAIYLVGAGVVGRAILKAHTDAGVSVCLADQAETALTKAVSSLGLDSQQWDVSELFELADQLPAIELTSKARPDSTGPPIVIESIAERLDVKQAFFAAAERRFGDEAILCSNTSTLRIGKIAETLERAERFGGMHFFMPVYNREAVEVIRGPRTSEATTGACVDHVHRIGKQPLLAGDGPGFVVNRLLSPYLNEAMLLLGRGISAEQIQRAALAYGMPMSPLELIDWIGTRTAFDAGRVYWQAFPSRLDPSPILPALIKRKRFGRAGGKGLYDYRGDVRSAGLADDTIELCQKYRRDLLSASDDEVMQRLSIPMWIEASLAGRDGVVNTADGFDRAMHGGLGFDPESSWLEFFDHLGSAAIRAAIEAWSPGTACMRAPPDLDAALENSIPSEALRRYAFASS